MAVRKRDRLRGELGDAEAPVRRLLLVALFACKTSSSVQRAETASQEAQTKVVEQQIVTQKIQTGPETVTTTVEEFAPPSGPSPARDRPCHDLLGSRSPEVLDCVSLAGEAGLSSVGSSPMAAERTVLERGPLVKRTVTVAQRGPSTQETHSEAAKASTSVSEAKATLAVKEEHKSAPGVSCAFFGWLSWLLPVGLLVLAWRFRTLIPWWPK